MMRMLKLKQSFISMQGMQPHKKSALMELLILMELERIRGSNTLLAGLFLISGNSSPPLTGTELHSPYNDGFPFEF